MIYELAFHKKALKEWKKLSPDIKNQLKKKLQERLQNPLVPSAKLRDSEDCYKIKLKTIGYRLIYQVKHKEVIVLVLAIGKRENDEVYNTFQNRLN
jgi:mRNA interferase RelE/StbE